MTAEPPLARFGVAIVVIGEVDAATARDAEAIVGRAVQEALFRSPERLNSGQLPARLAHRTVGRAETWDVTIHGVLEVDRAIGGGYLRVEPAPTAFPTTEKEADRI